MSRPSLGARVARPAARLAERLVRSRVAHDPHGARFDYVVAAARTLRTLDRATDTRVDPSRAGRALLAAAPNALGTLADRLPAGNVLVSATNGKTTTTNLLASIVRAGGLDPVVNHVGANMPGGLCAELVGRARRDRIDADIGVFEVDELWLDHVVPPLSPRAIVLGNLFRDQLDRMGELDRVAARWLAFVRGLPSEVVLVVNADDPRIYQLAAEHPNLVLIGMDAFDRAEPPEHADAPDCLKCGVRIRYNGVHIGHLGRWWCPGCGDRRPAELDLEARSVRAVGTAGASFVLSGRCADPAAASGLRITLELPGRFNVLNATAAAGAAVALGLGRDAVASGLANSPGAFGRAETVVIDGRRMRIVLAKNPSGLDEVVSLLLGDRRPLDLLMLLNDRDLDGRDVSWIWDAELERLANSISTVTCGGSRAAEAAMRLDYAGVASSRIEVVDGIERPLARALERASGELIALVNYSAMLDLRETVSEQGHVERYWR